MDHPLLRRAWVALAAVAVIPAAVLAATFHPAFLPPAVHRSVTFVRLACGLSLTGVTLLFALRRRLDAYLLRLDAHVRTVAATEPVPPPGKAPAAAARALVLLAVAVAVVSVVLAATSVDAFRAWIREDGVLEYGSSLAWFGAAGCGIIALRFDRRHLGVKFVWYLPLIAFCVFAGGEEISWGQRLIGYQVPELIASHNKQHEANLHDIGSISVYANVFFVLTTVLCLVIPLMLKRAQAWRVYLRLWNAPIIDPVVARVYGIGLATWIVVGVRFGTLGFSPLSLWGYYTQLDDEIFEFYASLGFFALAALDLAHRVRETRQGRGAAPAPST